MTTTTNQRYAVQASVTTIVQDGYTRTRQVPTFLLNADIQGITDELHAAVIARDIINPLGMDMQVHVTAVKL